MAVEKAIVPIIKVDFEEVKLDICIITGNFDLEKMRAIDESLLYDNQLLTNMDENMIKSYNAYRNAHMVYLSLSIGFDHPSLLPKKTR